MIRELVTDLTTTNRNNFVTEPDYSCKLIAPEGDIVIYVPKSKFNRLQKWFIHLMTGFTIEDNKKDQTN